ncbi:hypothetical protein O181_081590, partial [Austropuccinia psidii MF-1]|nr:hypothetical protein [Austropuccinia psidii MF-1]
MSLRTIRKMQKLNCVEGLPSIVMNQDVKLCHACSLAKSQHIPLSSPLWGIVEQPGDVIVADLMRPFRISFDKRIYAMLVQDHFSSLVTVYPLRSKAEAGSCLIDWVKKFNNLTNFNVKRIQTDNASEFLSNNLKRFFEESGITHETIIPYKHHQAGKVEPTNRTISEAAQSMMIDSGIDVCLWPYAFRQAVWVFNRVVHGFSDKTPYEMVMGRKPSLGVLRVFCCRAYMHNLTHKKDLSPKAKELIHLGIAEDSKGWLFWDAVSKQVVWSASVVFDEGDVGKATIPSAHSIEINNLFDPTMLQEIAYQDEALNITAAGCSLHNDSPSTYHEAMASSDHYRWAEAMEEELRSLQTMGVWESEDKANLKQALGCRWVYTVKRNQQGIITRHKARLVVQGHQQIKGLNFEETFAPTPTFNSLRCLLIVAAALNWEIQTFDVTTAYLHSKLAKTIYVKAPQGASNLPKVLKLQKALYGLKQAGRCWWNHLQEVLRKIGFYSNPEDQSTYTYDQADGKAMLWVHVDDGVIGASSLVLLSKLKSLLQLELMLKWDDKVRSIVGITIQWMDGGFKLCQPALIDKICSLDASNLTTSQPLPNLDLVLGEARAIDKEYLSRIGMLLYVAQATRPDIMCAVNFLARFSMNTTDRHWLALNHLIGYVWGTLLKSLILRPSRGQDVFNIFVDANWGGEGSRSQHGYVGLLWGVPVMWNSKRQTCITSSTCQAEYMAMSFASRACLWISQGLIGIAGHFTPTLLSDNKAAIQIVGDSGSRKNSRHIRQEFHLTNELLVTNQIKIQWINTAKQKADIMTKALGKIKVQCPAQSMRTRAGQLYACGCCARELPWTTLICQRSR